MKPLLARWHGDCSSRSPGDVSGVAGECRDRAPRRRRWDVQAALDAAQPGDEVVLEAGATFTGNFKLPKKPAGPVITIRTSATLPARRIASADAALMPKIASGSAAPALEGDGAKNWKFDGIQFLPNTRGLYNIVYTHSDAANITFDRVLIVGGPDGQKNAIAGNGSQIVLSSNSYREHLPEGNREPWVRCLGWARPVHDSRQLHRGGFDQRPVRRRQRLLAGTRACRHRRREQSPDETTGMAEHRARRQNLFELKSAKRVTVRNNLMENNWADAQNGYAILFTTRNDDGGSPWAVVENVVFVNNVVRGTEHGVNLLGVNDGDPSGQATNIAMRHNLFICSGNFLIAGGEVGDVIIEHNTVRNSGRMLMTLYKGRNWPAGGSPRAAQYAIRSLTFRNNLAYHNQYGVFGDEGAGLGATALNNLTRQRRGLTTCLPTRRVRQVIPARTGTPPAQNTRLSSTPTTRSSQAASIVGRVAMG